MLPKNPVSSGFSPIQQFADHKSLGIRCCLVGILILCGLSITALSQENPQPSDLPIITRITPDAAAAQTNVELEGYRLGANLDEGVRVLFVQGTAEYVAAPTGGGYDTANLKRGLQELNVILPEQMQAGPCQVVMEVNGSRSAPVTIQITAPTAPVVTDFRPHLPRAGETIWIEGAGFSDSDDIVLTDAQGKAYHFEGGRTSDANTAAFTLPADLPVGEATIRVIERRSGASLSSNSLSLRIVSGPTPLYLDSDWLMSVAPGQWLDLVAGSFEPLKSAERIDVMFQQKEQIVIVPTKAPSENGLRVQVPGSLAPGTVKIQTRIISGNEVSLWSDPVDSQLLDKPTAAKIYSLEIRPVRAEAAFKEGDKIVEIVPVQESDYPKVRVPTDKLSPGLVNVETRVWRGGEPSAWLFKHVGFFWPTKFLSDGTMGEVPFMERIYFGPDTPKEVTVYPGEKLILQGTFPAASVNEMEVILQGDGHAPVVLRPSEVANPRGAKISLPDDLEDGDWTVTVLNVEDRTSGMLPVKLRVGKASQISKVE